MSDRLLTQKELAEVLPVKARQIRNLVKEGLPQEELGARTLYPLAECVRWYIDYRERVRDGDRSELGEIKARKLTAQARLAEMEVAKADGELIPLVMHEERLGAILDRLRSKILAVPGSWSPRIVGVKGVREGVKRLKPLVSALLEALADTADELEDDAAA